MAARGRGRGFNLNLLTPGQNGQNGTPQETPPPQQQPPEPPPQIPVGRGGRGIPEMLLRRPGDQAAQPPLPQAVLFGGRGRAAAMLSHLQASAPASVPSSVPEAVAVPRIVDTPPPAVPAILGRGRGMFLQPTPAPSQQPAPSQKESPPRVQRATGAISRTPSQEEPLPTDKFSQMSISARHGPPVSRPGSSGNVKRGSVNYVKLNIAPGKGVFEYEVKFDPQIDGRSIRFKCLNQHMERLGGVKSFSGSCLYLPIRLPDKVTVLQSVHPVDNSLVTLTVTFKKQKDLSDCTHLYNVLFRSVMGKLRLVQFGRQHFDPKSMHVVPQHRLEVWPGYITSVDEFEGGVFLNCDASHRVLRSETVLNQISFIFEKNPANFKEAVAAAVIRIAVLTRYNNRLYRIDDIDWSLTPRSTFIDHRNNEMSFEEYYSKHYNINIKDKEQPLLISLVKKRGDKNAADKICLIPELCTITGLTDEMRSDYRLMKELAQYTRITPEQRQSGIRKFVASVLRNPEANKVLTDWGLSLDPSTVELNIRQLRPETIYFGRNVEASAGNNADWGGASTRNEVLSAVDIKNWVIIHTKRDQGTARKFEETIERVANPMGMYVKKPHLFGLQDDRTESYMKALRENVKSDVDIVVVLCPTQRQDRYAAIKKYCCVEAPIASQVIQTKTLMKQERIRSVVQKVLLQMNCKMGGTLWKLKIPISNAMICGFDAYHDPASRGSSVSAFVSSYDEDYTRWFSKIIIQGPKQEIADSMRVCFEMGIRQYLKHNNRYPSKVFFYRDGVGDGQLRTSTNYEIPQLTAVFNDISPDCHPEFVFIVCQKRINTRIFAENQRGGRIEYDNPGPGSICDHTVTRRNYYDFFLVSQHVRQGTVSPTHYIVIHDTTQMAPDHVQRLTYKLTHLYYNWPGTIRVPAPCQYAHKLAQLVGQNIKREPSQHLADRLYFL